MSRYILNENIALRSYRKLSNVYITKNEKFCNLLAEPLFNVLLNCDGKKEIEDDNATEFLLYNNLIKKCEEGKEYSLTKWQEYKYCDNRYVPIMYLQITGRCNYNCLHCFNAKDNAPLQTEFTYDELMKLFDEMADCGMSGLRITGGEPLIYDRILDVIDEIYKRGLCVFEFNTNGSLLTKEVLDRFIKNNHKPQLRISFDGLGYHNWMRGVSGAEKDTINAIKLAKSMGFQVLINMNINKKNLPSIEKSLDMLDSMGVDVTRLIRTTDAPRWDINKKDMMFTFEEYYDETLNIIKNYSKVSHKMDVVVWQYITYYPKDKCYNIYIAQNADTYDDDFPICHIVRQMISVGSNGNVYPCLMMSGYYENYNIKKDNVKDIGLKKILNDSLYMNVADCSIKKKLENNEDCAKCEYLKQCRTGCPALTILSMGSIDKHDFTKCIFFKNGFYDKTIKTLDGAGLKRV